MPMDAFTVEHVIPLRRGGIPNFTNLVGSCLECNKKKDLIHRVIEYFDMRCGGLMEAKQDPWESR